MMGLMAAVGNYESRMVDHEAPQCFLEAVFEGGVQSGGGFMEDQNTWIANQGTGPAKKGPGQGCQGC
jgi:hypothetical protein